MKDAAGVTSRKQGKWTKLITAVLCDTTRPSDASVLEEIACRFADFVTSRFRASSSAGGWGRGARVEGRYSHFKLGLNKSSRIQVIQSDVHCKMHRWK